MIQLNLKLSILGMDHKVLAATCYLTPMSGFVQLLKINNQNWHKMGHQSSACAQKIQRTK